MEVSFQTIRSTFPDKPLAFVLQGDPISQMRTDEMFDVSSNY